MTVVALAVTVIVGTVGAGLVLSRPSDVEHDGAGTSATGAEPDASHRIAEDPAPPSAAPAPLPFEAPTAEEVALLPEARYDAVIPDLIDTPPTADEGDLTPDAAYSLLADAPLYGRDRTTAVARLAASNFLGEPTVVIPVSVDGDWTLVLTPARQLLPSLVDGDAPAQTSGWLRTDLLVHPQPLPHRIVVSVGARSLSIITGDIVAGVFDIGIGTPDTPTPVGVTGYLQARYLDPAQGQDAHRVQLTSLHSTVADEPYGGSDGGLIGIHYSPEAAGTVSHGCIRLSAQAIDAVDALPLGTPVTVLA